MSEIVELQAVILERIEAGRAQIVGDTPFIVLFELDSGVRYGVDASARWSLKAPEEDALRYFEKGTEGWFMEWVEHARDDIESALEEGVAAAELPFDLIAASFPAVELVRALLESRSTHGSRLALKWLFPSELRDLRTELLAFSKDVAMPQPLRELAGHLVVPE